MLPAPGPAEEQSGERGQRGDEGDERAHEDEQDADHHVEGDGLPQEDQRKNGRQCGLEEKDQRGRDRGRGLHRHEVEGESSPGHADADVQHHQGAERSVPRKQRNMDEKVQPQRSEEPGYRLQTAERHHAGHFQTGEQEAPAGHDHAGKPGAQPGAEHGVEGERRRGQQGECDPRRADGRVQRVDQYEDAEAFQHQRNGMLATDGGVQDKPCEHQDEHGVATEQHGDDRRVGMLHGKLIQRHADDDAQKAERREFQEADGVQAFVAFVQHPPGERDEDKAADEKPREVELYGIELPGHLLERDLHRAEKQRRQCDKQITPLHDRLPCAP